MGFHSLLDWRLGVGLLRLMADNDYSSGLKEEDYSKPELLDWKISPLNYSSNLLLHLKKMSLSPLLVNCMDLPYMVRTE